MNRRERAWSKRLQVTQGCARKLTADEKARKAERKRNESSRGR